MLFVLMCLLVNLSGTETSAGTSSWSSDFGRLGCNSEVNDLLVWNGEVIAVGYFNL
jgi:hypothetical protein